MIEFYKPAMGSTGAPVQRRFQVEANTTVTKGAPVKLKVAGSNYVIVLADAEPVVGTTTKVIGFAVEASDATASSDGTVLVELFQPGATYLAPAKTASAIDTQAEYNALVNNQVLFDLTSSVYTVDESATHNANNGLLVVDLDTEDRPGKVAFQVLTSAVLI